MTSPNSDEATPMNKDSEVVGSVETLGVEMNGSEGGVASGSASSDAENKLAEADELFQRGSKAISESNFTEAVDCFSRSLEIRVFHYGELAPECAISYYKYGCALLYKAQEETDPIGNVLKKPQDKSGDGSAIAEGKSSATHAKQNDSGATAGQIEEDSDNSDEENVNAGSDGEELMEGDEEESDLDLAWKMLDIARAIVEKHQGDTIEKVNILSALAEVSMEREDFETSLNDYLKALSVLERLVEPDDRRIIELNFRICLVLDVSSRTKEAIPYCEKAIELCKSRLQQLKENAEDSKPLTDDNMSPVVKSDKCDNQLSKNACSDPSKMEEEIQVLSDISGELEKKLEDLNQALSFSKTVLSEVFSMISPKAKSSQIESKPLSPSLGSSQIGAISDGFDSPTVSTAANSDSITHLGVVGRGIKRPLVAPIPSEPSQKKPLQESSAEKTSANDSSSVVESNGQDSEASTK